MPKFVVEVWMDGYDSDEEMEQACIEYLEDMSATAITVKVIEKVEEK